MPDDMSQWAKARGAEPRDCDPRRLVIRRQQQMVQAAELERAARVGATPDPHTMRGAEPATIRARLEGNGLRRHAVWRQPEAHASAPRIDRLYAARELDERLYQNACAAMELCRAAGLFKSKGVAEWLRTQRGHDAGLGPTPEDELRQLIREGGVEFQAVLMLLDPEEPPVLPYMWGRALKGLAKLDHIAARWDGQRWEEE